MSFAEIPGVRLWYTDTGGSGEPLVFLHAASGNAACWGQQIPVFRDAGYRCIAYDRRGWGQSSGDPEIEHPGYACDDLLALIEHLGCHQVHLAATAAGCAVAVDFALSYPDRVGRLVVADGSCGVQEEAYQTVYRRARPPEIEGLPVELRELSASYRGTNPEGMAAWVAIEHASHQADGPQFRQGRRTVATFTALRTLRAPTLVIMGDADLTIPPALGRMMAGQIPGSQFSTIAEAGHAAFWEQPDEWNRLALTFLQEGTR